MPGSKLRGGEEGKEGSACTVSAGKELRAGEEVEGLTGTKGDSPVAWESGKGKVKGGEENVAEVVGVAKGKHVSWKTSSLETKHFLEARLYNL